MVGISQIVPADLQFNHTMLPGGEDTVLEAGNPPLVQEAVKFLNLLDK